MSTPVARLFDAMAASYDEMEPWYDHLYTEVHALLRTSIGPAPAGGGIALDAGCGTGYQAAILAELGWRLHGIDISGGLLALARDRLSSSIGLVRGDLMHLPYADSCFDAVVCCGSTLSFVDDPLGTVAELARVLRQNGRLLIECEHQPSLDLLWTLLSALSGDRLAYGVALSEAWRALCQRRDVWISYPDYGRLRLFTWHELQGSLAAAGLIPVRAWGFHTITNVIPSTTLHRSQLPRGLATPYRLLRRLDAIIAASPLARAFCNSLVVLAERAQPSA
jgi:SAM-dependent methyltransferase